MLKQIFTHLIQNSPASEKLWSEIEKNYSLPARHYHTLNHLENLYAQLSAVRNEIQDWETVLFALFYHDIIYKVLRKDNEERSAALAVKRLNVIGLDAEKISKCEQIILATKTHTLSNDNDTNLFTDADLSVLGMSFEIYTDYYQKIRKEYGIYPDFMYNPGRKKVLQHFLEMPYIYKTKVFRAQFEAQARENIEQELKLF
jgi:predicted metal-dependent HD superfamily phosphohydrolase